MPTKDVEKQRAYRRKWYVANKQKQIDRQMARRRELRVWFTEYKRTLCCSATDCGRSFKDNPEWCDFHHLDPNIKEGQAWEMVRSSKAKLMRELEKCVPLCALCHRTLHANEGA